MDWKRKARLLESRRKCAFTLIESLVAVAIIAVLAALLVPMVNSLQQKETDAECISNLRQVTTAGLLYVGDNDGRFPSMRAHKALVPYLGLENWRKGNGPTVMTCPAAQKQHPTQGDYCFTYSMNMYLSSQRDEDDQTVSSWMRNRQLFGVSDIGKIYFFMDGGIASPDSASERNVYSPNIKVNSNFQFPHSERINVSMLDGSVKAVSRDDFMAPEKLKDSQPPWRPSAN